MSSSNCRIIMICRHSLFIWRHGHMESQNSCYWPRQWREWAMMMMIWSRCYYYFCCHFLWRITTYVVLLKALDCLIVMYTDLHNFCLFHFLFFLFHSLVKEIATLYIECAIRAGGQNVEFVLKNDLVMILRFTIRILLLEFSNNLHDVMYEDQRLVI